jgi:dephospho-CoA kinase
MRPRVIGLTGGIGSGKSTVATILRELGCEIIDADQVARDVVRPGLPAYEEIVSSFGRDVLLPDGTLDRKKLAAIVFRDPAARLRLEAITHPRIALETQRRIGEAGARGAGPVVYEATLLVENGLHCALDGLIVVDAPREAQIARTCQRDGLAREEAQARIDAQMPPAKKLAAADWVIENDGGLDELRARVVQTFAELSRARRG